MVVFGDHNQRKFLDRRKIQSFMKGAGTHAAVANVSNRDDRFFLHSSGEQHARHHWNHVAEMRDWTNEPLLHVAEVNIEIAAAGRSPGLRHILRKNLARTNSLYE